jgi:glyoxylase-like metal-dependent hydrolase (beta-lactamase superfamily II)
MSRVTNIPKDEADEIFNIYNLEAQMKEQIFDEFKQFKLQTSIRRFIKKTSKKIDVSEQILWTVFRLSYSLHILYIQNGETFDEFYNNTIKAPILLDSPEVKKQIEDFDDIKKFIFDIMNLIDFEYYEVHEIDGIKQISVGYSMVVSLYIFTVNENVILIDAGHSMPYWKSAFYKALKEINIDIVDIDYCIITHEHPDHTGTINDLKRINPNIKICMHDIAFKLAKQRLEVEDQNDPYKRFNQMQSQLIKNGMSLEELKSFSHRSGGGGGPGPMMFDYVEPDIVLHDNETLFEDQLKILHTPGHSAGCICILYLPKGQNRKILFTGDHILSDTTPNLNALMIPGAEKFNEENDFKNILEHYLNSLDRIDKLDPHIILAGHDDLIPDPHKRITEIKNHHQNRLYEISNIVYNNPLPPYQISMRHWEDLDGINKIFATGECLVHLNYLEDRGVVQKEEKDGVIYYSSKKPWDKIEY